MAGEDALLDVLEAAIDAGVEWFTIFVFSTENWHRSAAEVEFLMEFCYDLLVRRSRELAERSARLWSAADLSDPRIPHSAPVTSTRTPFRPACTSPTPT